MVLIPILLYGQQTEGEITFNQKIKIKIDFPEGQEEMAKMFPSEQNFKKTLLFTDSESLYFDKKEEESEKDMVIETEDENTSIKIVMVGAKDNREYKNLAKNSSIRKEDFFGKTFLITGEPKKYAWKLTGKQKEILGFQCQQATFTEDSTTVIAWFSPEIPVSNGPGAYGALPGMILEVDVNDGAMQLVAEEVNFRKIEKDEITAPKKGKKVSAKKFEEIVDRKTKEMAEEMGGDGAGIKIEIN